MSSDDLFKVHLFPLPQIVFFPHTQIPLNIFESRYIAMINHSLTHGIPIALVHKNPLETNAIEEHLIAGYGSPVVLDKREDSTMLVLLQGQGVVEIVDVIQKEPFITARARIIPQETQISDDDFVKVRRLKNLLFKAYEQVLPDLDQRKALVETFTLPEQIVEALATMSLQDFDSRQLLLETTTLKGKIAFIDALLDSDGRTKSAQRGDLN